MCDGYGCTEEGKILFEGKWYCVAHTLTVTGGYDPIYKEEEDMELYSALTFRAKRTRAKKPTPPRAKSGVKKFKPYKIKTR